MEVVLHVGGENMLVPLTGDSIAIGRSASYSQLVIKDEGLSRCHALICREDNCVRVVDQQSVNGTYVNCDLVPPGGAILADDDEIFMGNHTVIKIKIKQEQSRKHVNDSNRTFFLMFVLPVVVVAFLIGAAVINRLKRPSGAQHIESRRLPSQQKINDGPTPEPINPQRDATLPADESTLREEIVEIPNGSPKLYKSLNDEQKREFIKVRAGRIALMMGKRPYAFTPDALEYIKFWLDAFASRVGNNRTGLWRGDTKFILQRGSVHAPLIIRAFKENRVPPVIGLYIPFIETEYTNIQSNNAAGAAGLFQFLGPTAEHYGVPSSERTDVAKMAPAAARYFRDNIMSFGDDSMSVALAIAGYNRAPESVKRDLRNVLSAENNEDKERNFWTLIANQGRLDHFFQSENKNYVPRFFAAAILGETPWAFGIDMRPLSTFTTTDTEHLKTLEN
jgi:pSer/pThr/pTyr-binding forkhead associated (FHA) protein